MLEIDGTLLVIFISFMVFMFIMQKIFYAPISEVRKARQNYIDTNKEMAASAKTESETVIKEYNDKITQARINANNVVSTLTTKANKEKTDILEEHSKKIAEETKFSREGIEKDKIETKEALKPQILSLAHFISSKILGEEIPISADISSSDLF